MLHVLRLLSFKTLLLIYNPPSFKPYIDEGGVGANSASDLSLLQLEIGNVLGKGGFLIKSWESSGEDEASKYLGMTWNGRIDNY